MNVRKREKCHYKACAGRNIKENEQNILYVILLISLLLPVGKNPAAGMPANIASARIHVQSIRESLKWYEEEQAQIQTEEPKMPITYEELEKAGYVIREKNICVNPQPVSENPWLCQQEVIQKYIKQAEEDREWHLKKGYEAPAYIMEYFQYDLNDDAVCEYIVSFSGGALGGITGNTVLFCEKTEDGLVVHKRLRACVYHGQEKKEYEKYGYGDYWPIAVLEMKTGGYHAFVMSWSQNAVWEYNEEDQEYS
ncbi:MAG: hypothetical protein HFI91_13300 [Lachnospiraceae bacterium]|nr:hypothetical protein [Lachnospiraceae bacterium]